MPVQLIHIVREMTDTGGRTQLGGPSFCYAEMESSEAAFWEPDTDIFESEDEVFIRMDLGGIKREEVSIRLKNGKLCIFGVRKENRPDAHLHFHQLELSYGPFGKIISIPADIEHNDITAHLNEGLLEIIISKKGKIVEIPIAEEIVAKVS